MAGLLEIMYKEGILIRLTGRLYFFREFDQGLIYSKNRIHGSIYLKFGRA